eukprot:TRINITY_DN26814_c0_g1_i1.p1 TRINITY_DN26814_c0_g1~~TRINITY_DN26814_c0_g1_i1.p1  ORF type:complete len:353 (+),score=103.91 TRINITY_DN26814_c0_g1_i1:80-1060(+)
MEWGEEPAPGPDGGERAHRPGSARQRAARLPLPGSPEESLGECATPPAAGSGRAAVRRRSRGKQAAPPSLLQLVAAAAAAATPQADQGSSPIPPTPNLWRRGRLTLEGVARKLQRVREAETQAAESTPRSRRVAGCSLHLLQRRSPVPRHEISVRRKRSPQQTPPAKVSGCSRRLYRPREEWFTNKHARGKSLDAAPAAKVSALSHILSRLYDTPLQRAQEEACRVRQQLTAAQVAPCSRWGPLRVPVAQMSEDERKEAVDRLSTAELKRREELRAERLAKLAEGVPDRKVLSREAAAESVERLHTAAIERQHATTKKLCKQYLSR